MKKEQKTIKTLMLVFALCMITVAGSYIINFKNSSVSGNPADWGVLGDYFGGILNPLISLMALFFLTKTYLAQKDELKQSEIAAEAQRKISARTMRMQLLGTKISASYEAIAVYRGEMEGVTIAMNAGGHGRSYTALDGKVRFSDNEQKDYRIAMAAKVSNELATIEKYLKELEELGDIQKVHE
ncbi:hypothetical protein AB7M31_004622 [Pseudomonas sp. IAP-CY TE4608]